MPLASNTGILIQSLNRIGCYVDSLQGARSNHGGTAHVTWGRATAVQGGQRPRISVHV